MKNLYICIVVCLLFSEFYAQKYISYDDAVKISIKNNLRVKQVENDLRVNKALKSISKLNFLPRISAISNGAETKGFQFSNQEQKLVNQSISRLNVSLRVDLIVFNGFANHYDFNRNRKLHDAKEQELVQLKQDIVFETTKKYLQHLLDQEMLNISKENRKTNKLIFDQVSEFVKEGRIAGLDSISQNVNFERSKLNVANALNRLSINKRSLLRTMAFDGGDNINFMIPDWKVSLFDTILYNSKELVKKSYSVRSDLQKLNLEKEAQKKQERIFKSQRLPRISMFYIYGSNYISNRTRRNIDTNEFEDIPFRRQLLKENLVSQYGFNINIPLFTNFSNKENITRAKVELENKDYEIDDLKRKIALDIRNSIENFHQLKKAFEVAQKVSNVAQLSFDKQKKLYDLGLGNLVTLNIESQRNFKAKSEELQAKYTLLFQQKIIDYQVGTILE